MGIITEKDIKEFSPSKASTLDIYEMHNVLAKTEFKEAITKDVITVFPDDQIERAALILRYEIWRITSNRKKRWFGWDYNSGRCFWRICRSNGDEKTGSRVHITVDDKPGAIAEIAAILKKYELNIISLATFLKRIKMKVKGI